MAVYDYSGVTKFISETKGFSIVDQTPTGLSVADGFRYIKGDLSAKTVGDTVNYDYTGTPDDNTVTIG